MSSTAPVFIVGSPRSGTTLTYHLLLASGGFAIYRAEAEFYNTLGPLFGNFRTLELRKEFLEQWYQSELFKRSGLNIQDIEKSILESCDSPGACQKVFMDAIVERQGARRWADTTPINCLFIDRIQCDFPKAFIVHMIRDGRDVAMSLAKQRWIKPLPWHRKEEYLPAGAYWQWCVGRAQKWAKRLGNRYLEVRFEDLISDRDACLDRLFAFLGEAYDRERIDQNMLGSISRPNTSFLQDDASSSFSPLNRWRQLPEENQRQLESFLGSVLDDLHYPRQFGEGRSFGFAQRMYSWRFELRQRLKSQSWLARKMADRSLLNWAPPLDRDDFTLRPGENPAEIERLVGSQT
ncbi:sulfotransferase [Thermodesulfobacteriota bacterium]